MIDSNISKEVAIRLGLKEESITTALRLLEEGATVPFLARYRKEEIGGLSDEELDKVVVTYKSVESFTSRLKTILKEIESQGKLTPELNKALLAARTLSELEDLYRPFKPKRATRGSKALAAGLKPVAELIEAGQEYEELAATLIQEEGFDSLAKVIQGALDIIAEEISDEAIYRTYIKQRMKLVGKIVSSGQDLTKDPKFKFKDYYDKTILLKNLRSHTFLALSRGEKEGILKLKYEFPEEEILQYIFSKRYKIENKNAEILKKTIEDSFNRLIKPSVSNDINSELFSLAEEESLKTFSRSLNDILMKAPYKTDVILGFDPGFHHGCKIAVIDKNGSLLATDVIYPTTTKKAEDNYLPRFKKMLKDYHVNVIALGNGTASREAEDFIKRAIEDMNDVSYEIVSEDGASIYSVTKIAQEEFPDFDPNLRSAVSIARRLLDPLSELVKIDPSGLGVGMYQHDIDKKKLSETLGTVVVNTVNRVGVDVNTASISLLSYVSGINKTIAKNIVDHIKKNGSFKNRQQLLKVKGLGDKAFVNCAGFLRIDGDEPFDLTAVHPESYDLAKKILAYLNIAYPAKKEQLSLVKDEEIIKMARDFKLEASKIKDIVEELAKPNRDPRGVAEVRHRDEKIRSLDDLSVGMILEGSITNITDFGAFVDLGIHTSGLIHISKITDSYITKDDIPKYLRIGMLVKVRVETLDKERERIGLSMNFKSDSVE